jgi:glycerol-3-phosphate cytidylyltransferase
MDLSLRQKLSNDFKNWDINVNDMQQSFVLTSKGDDNTNLTPCVIETATRIKELFSDKKMEIKLISYPADSIVVTLKKSHKKYTKMYTSGCFDIFHYGHFNILMRTKEMCDYLVVGVSTDELIFKEKGRAPVIPFNERKRIIEALSFVDEVIPQFDKNKQKVVDVHNIDAISVGEDWKGRFPKTSCNVEYLPYTYSVSSTILKNALKLVEASIYNE